MSLVIKNGGALAALTTARLYYADPTTTFTATVLAHRMIFQQTLYIGAGAQQETPAAVWTPDNTTPFHVCLLAEVGSIPLDPSTGTYDAVSDRHYGQQNINVLMVQPGQKKSFSFRVANGGRETEQFTVLVRSVGEEALHHLEKLYNSEAVSLRPTALSVQVVEPGLRRQSRQELKLQLKPGETRLCQLMLDVPRDLNAHQFIAIEVEQLPSILSEQARISTLGIIAFVSEAESQI